MGNGCLVAEFSDIPEGFEVQQFPAIGTRGNAPGESILNPDGTSSSERTISVGFGDITKLIPTIVPDDQGFLVKRSDEDAIALFRQGKNPSVGDFGSVEEADAFAETRSEGGGRNFQQFSDVPEGFSVDQQQFINQVPELEPERPPPRTVSERVLRGIASGGRILAETPGLTIAGLSDLLSKGVNTATGLVGLDTSPIFAENAAQTVQEGFNRMGFPQPESKLEEFTQRTGRAVVGAGFGPAAGRSLTTATSPVTRSVGKILQESPTIQAAGAATGAASGFAAREAGAPPLVEQGAELLGGGLGPAATVGGVRAATSTGRAALGLKDALTRQGQRKIVGNVLEESAINAERAARNIADEQAFGGLTERTTGQASRDPGLLTLERAARSLDTRGRFAQKESQSNVRRQRILDVIGGEDVSIAKAARDVTTGAQREAAFAAAKPLSTKPIISRIDAILRSPQGTRRVVKQALNSFKKDIEGVTDAEVLYEVRKDINAAMQGKFRDPKKSDFQLAKSQLKLVKNAIDDTIETSAPGFKKYLEDYARLSRDIDRRGVIQNIQERSSLAASDPTTGRDILSQARFKRLVNSERQAGTLTDEQLTVLQSIADDLDLGQAINSATVRPPGSDTAKNLTVAHIIGRSFGGSTDSPVINTLAKPFRWLTNFSEDQVQGILVDAMLDPRMARLLLNEANAAQVNRASRSLQVMVAGSTVGAALGAQTDVGQQ